MRGNSRLKSLAIRLSNLEVANRELLAIAGALRENKGLVELEFFYRFNVNEEMLSFLCESLKTHPTLEVLDLSSAITAGMTSTDITPRMHALLDMMKVNISIQIIRLRAPYRPHHLFRESVIPYLERNRFWLHVLAIQQTRPIPYRTKVLGQALLAVRSDPNRF